jgi:hypothetical protein
MARSGPALTTGGWFVTAALAQPPKSMPVRFKLEPLKWTPRAINAPRGMVFPEPEI